MRTHLLALAILAASVESAARETAPLPEGLEQREVAKTGGATGGIRTDRLSADGLRVWSSILAIVKAEDRQGRPLCPTLRRLFEEIDRSGHAVLVEIADSKRVRSYVGGQFLVERVDPEGKAPEGRIVINLRAIDKAATDPGAARRDGFIPFAKLGRAARYAELLGRELAHAAWAFANVERAKHAAQMQCEVDALAELVLAIERGRAFDQDREQRLRECEAWSRTTEAVAETTEAAIWMELRAAKQLR
jgi:hypothetical protein